MQQLLRAEQPVTLMVTGPLTTVAEAIAREPKIVEKVEALVWMGGALKVPGNVESIFAPEHDGSAEWNVFWDLIAAHQIWETTIPIILCPLDLTNTVPATSDFLRKLARQRRYILSDLAGLCYSLAMTQNYYFWDVLATAYLLRPDLYQLVEMATTIITVGASQGQTMIAPQGRKIKVMVDVNRQGFNQYLLQQFAVNP